MIDAFLYTADARPISIDEFSQLIERRFPLALATLTDFKSLREYRLGESVLVNGDVLCAWERGTPFAARIHEAVRNRHADDLQHAADADCLWACRLSCQSPPQPEMTAGEMRDAYGPAAADALHNAKVAYSTTTHLGRSEKSVVWQFLALQAMGYLRGGLLEDPASGDALVLRAGESTLLPCLKFYLGPEGVPPFNRR